MIEILFTFTFTAALLLFKIRNRKIDHAILLFFAAGLLFLSVLIIGKIPFPLTLTSALSPFFRRDPLSDLFFIITSIVFTAAALSSISFLNRRNDRRWDSLYTIFIMIFTFSMTGALFSAHYGLFWVFIEATTITSAVLIYFERTHSALAAAWKYIFICSIGIAFAFVGIILLTIGSNGNESLFFADMTATASQYSPFWLKMSFVFLIAGFGTKVGLAPMHSWKPDAYAEAPSPVSAVLAGALSNCAFLGIIRILPLMKSAGLADEAKSILLFMGILSVAVAALFMLRENNIKKMLAYSSIEQMGLIAIGIASGGVYGALLLSITHSFIKSSLFITAGNIEYRFSSRRFQDIASLAAIDVRSAVLLFTGAAAITAFPPFASFTGEFMIFSMMFKSSRYIAAAAVLFLLVVIIFAFISKLGFLFSENNPPKKINSETAPFSAIDYIPQTVLILAVLYLGFHIPVRVHVLLEEAAKTIGFN